MSKAILVMDMPDSCDGCPLFGNHYSDLCCKGLNNRGINYPYPKDFKQKWCPLKEVPQKVVGFGTDNQYVMGRKDGWNACIYKALS